MGCEVTSQGLPAIIVRGGADPHVSRSRIHNSSVGISISEYGRGTFEDNEIFAAGCGVQSMSAAVILRANRIHDCLDTGVFLAGGALGTIEDNVIFASANAGIAITEGSNPTVRRNDIHDCSIGISIARQGRGICEDNNIFDNDYGVFLTEGSYPILRGNRIGQNHWWAISVSRGAGGNIEHNELYANTLGAWHIDKDSDPKLQRVGNIER